MPDFVGIAPSDEIQRRETFRIVVERQDFAVTLSDLGDFANVVTSFYNAMLARTGVVYPVSPNPAVYNAFSVMSGWSNEQKDYAIDVRVADYPVGFTASEEITLTAADVVNKLNSISPRIGVVRFERIGEEEVTDAAARDDLAAQQQNKSNVFGDVKSLLTLAVIGLVALAVIQISKDL